MTADAQAPLPAWKETVPAWKWAIVAMLLLATVVNYMDRQTLGSVASFIKRDFHLKEEGYGGLESCFGYSYAVFLILSGFLADRVDLRWLYTGALVVWSAAGFATGYATTLLELQICRTVLGASEAFNWPVAVSVVRSIIPRESQAFANSIFNTGVTFGAVFTPMLVIGMVDDQGHGWRVLFKVVGFAGLVVVAAWLWATRGARAQEMSRRHIDAAASASRRNQDAAASASRRHNDAAGAGSSEVRFRDLFSMRKFWITASVGVAANVAWQFYRVWLPRHLVVDLRFTDKELQYLLIGFYLTADLGSIAIGFLSRILVGPARTVERARKIVVLLSALFCLLATPLLLQPSRWVMVPLYCLVGAGIMGVFAMFYSLVQDIVPGHTSKSLGIIGASAWFINSRLHPVVGRFADSHSPAIGKFAPLLLLAGAAPLLAALFALTWPEPSERGHNV